jgi:membrane protease YdiL (CAAX protease family)
VNGSPSTTSPAWPTHWPKDSFTGIWTWALAVVAALPFVGAFAFGVARPVTISYASVTPFELYLSLGGTAALEGVLVAIVLFALPKLSKFSLRELGFRVPSLRDAGIAGLGAIAMVVVANGLASLIDTLSHVKHQQDVVAMFRALHDPRTLAAFAFFAVIVAPLAEEMLFRVFFFNLGLRYGGFWAGAVLSGVLFGMAHGDLYAAVPLALGGIILCYVYYRTRNAWASVITHGTFNSLSLVAILFAPSWVSS